MDTAVAVAGQPAQHAVSARVMSFARRLLNWYDDNGRSDLPWKRNASAYRVWVSEIMLQQTRVQTAIPYYRRFIRRFPGVRKLAQAPLGDVMSHWSGLGYYSRARNLHAAARIVRERFGGRIPKRFDDLVKLPGIGRSTAAAILALAHGERHAILDGNVKRILARHGDIAGWPGRAAVGRRLWRAAEKHLPQDRIADYTQAMMDLGALVCTKTNPDCKACPVARDCRARIAGRVARRPAPKPARARQQRRIVVLMALHRNRLLLERRPAAGIWGHLLSFPEAFDKRRAQVWYQHHLGEPDTACYWPAVRHDLTHLRLVIVPLKLEYRSLDRGAAADSRFVWCTLSAASGTVAAPIKRLIRKLEEETNGTDGSLRQTGRASRGA